MCAYVSVCMCVSLCVCLCVCVCVCLCHCVLDLFGVITICYRKIQKIKLSLVDLPIVGLNMLRGVNNSHITLKMITNFSTDLSMLIPNLFSFYHVNLCPNNGLYAKV